MIISPNSEPRGPRPVSLVAVHTAEGSRTAQSLGAYFANPASQVSSHLGVDAEGVEQYVDFDRAAWTIRTGNPITDNLELCGFAEMTSQQWLSEDTITFHSVALDQMVIVDKPAVMLRNAAAAVRARCLARGIPMVKLSPADIAAGKSGVIGHVDWTIGMRDGTHRDPGDGFPWTTFIQLVNDGTPAVPTIPTHGKGDPLTPIPITVQPDGTFHATAMVESGGSSQTVAQAWLDVGVTYGGASFRLTALGANAAVLAVWPAGTPAGQLGHLANNAVVEGWVLPQGTVMVTVEGCVDVANTSPSTEPSASVSSLPR